MATNPLRSPWLWAGAGVWLACLAGWGLLWATDRDAAVAAGATFAAFLIAGKIAAIPTGFALELSPVLIGLIIFLPDFGTVLLLFPLTHSGLTVLGRWSRFVRRLRENAARAAERREGVVAKYGSFGLFLLSLAPIGFYSPLVISAIGQLMGLSALRVLVPIALAMVLMTAVWVAALGAGLAAAAQVDQRLPLLATAALVGFLVLRGLVRQARKAIRRRRERLGRES